MRRGDVERKPPPLKKETKLGISLYNPPKVGLKVVFINSKVIKVLDILYFLSFFSSFYIFLFSRFHLIINHVAMHKSCYTHTISSMNLGLGLYRDWLRTNMVMGTLLGEATQGHCLIIGSPNGVEGI